MLAELRALLASTPEDSAQEDYRRAVLDDNVLGKGSSSSRHRSFRYLRELYGLDLHDASFHALRKLWSHDVEAQPLIALASSLMRDSALRGTAGPVLSAPLGAPVSAHELATAVNDAYPGSYSDTIAHKIGRNAASTWTQSGHLEGRVKKVRHRAHPRPASVAYALFLASLEGREGELLFDALVVQAQDAPRHELKELAREASRRGWIDYRSVGNVSEIVFSYLALEVRGRS